MQIIELTPEWQTIPVATGTIGNRSNETVEVARADDPEGGLLVYPKSKYSFKNAVVKARTATGTKAAVALVNYTSGGTDGAGTEEDEATTQDIDALF